MQLLKIKQNCPCGKEKNSTAALSLLLWTNYQGWTQRFSTDAIYVDLPAPLMSSLTPTCYHHETQLFKTYSDTDSLFSLKAMKLDTTVLQYTVHYNFMT